jgi:hypothetical protein
MWTIIRTLHDWWDKPYAYAAASYLRMKKAKRGESLGVRGDQAGHQKFVPAPAPEEDVADVEPGLGKMRNIDAAVLERFSAVERDGFRRALQARKTL